MTAKCGQRRASDHKVQLFTYISAGPRGKTPHLTSAKRVILKPSETSGQSRFPASSTSSEPTEARHQSPYGACTRCFALLSVILHAKAKHLLASVFSAAPLRAPGEQPQQTSSKVLPSTAGGQSNQGPDNERVTFPSQRDCWDLLEGIQLINEHSRAESGLESVINCHKTSKSEYIGGTRVCPRDGPRKRGSAPPNPY